jgi:hypothetical protein
MVTNSELPTLPQFQLEDQMVMFEPVPRRIQGVASDVRACGDCTYYRLESIV